MNRKNIPPHAFAAGCFALSDFVFAFSNDLDQNKYDGGCNDYPESKREKGNNGHAVTGISSNADRHQHGHKQKRNDKRDTEKHNTEMLADG